MVWCAELGPLFGVNEQTGDVRLLRELDFERHRAHTLLIEAADAGAPAARTSIATLIVNVENVNDDMPRVEVDYLGPRERAVVSEGAEPGEFVALVFVYDADPVPPLDCQSNNPRFALNRKHNGVNGNGARYAYQYTHPAITEHLELNAMSGVTTGNRAESLRVHLHVSKSTWDQSKFSKFGIGTSSSIE